MTEQKMWKWEQHTFSSGGTTGEDYRAFQKEMKADLKKHLNEAGLTLDQFLNGHYEFSAVVTNGTHYAYISIRDVRYHDKDRLFEDILYRTMKHNKDWTGGQNNYCDWNDVAVCCKDLIEKEERLAARKHNDIER